MGVIGLCQCSSLIKSRLNMAVEPSPQQLEGSDASIQPVYDAICGHLQLVPAIVLMKMALTTI